MGTSLDAGVVLALDLQTNEASSVDEAVIDDGFVEGYGTSPSAFELESLAVNRVTSQSSAAGEEVEEEEESEWSDTVFDLLASELFGKLYTFRRCVVWGSS